MDTGYITDNHMQLCYFDKDKCPCRLVDLDSNISFCNFVRLFADILILNNERATNLFLDKVCDDKRNEVLHHDYRAGQLRKRFKKFLNQVKIGDLVYSIAEDQDVVFLESPTHKYGDCKYRIINGTVKKAPPFLFSMISKGKYYGKYETKNKDKADLYTLEARECGFRVEKHELEDHYVLKIYGDTQEEVDSFITVLRSNFIIDDY